ncbi:MAG: hypothetical protein ACD_2C00174G0007 [uncultured bacterium (gcode 4)]|uniref:Uncharacterized protein n=1 Tax=uncultured bacterium (gcode 4) TaxID=1234023 RepID=K2H0T9_9BACT|nr:MAG: hypothetical protein ACD_2C00174G0007 [uncultured bacterium (gcode 4)]
MSGFVSPKNCWQRVSVPFAMIDVLVLFSHPSILLMMIPCILLDWFYPINLLKEHQECHGMRKSHLS